MIFRLFVTFAILLLSVIATAGNKNAITYQGRILLPNGRPLDAIVNFRFVLRSPTNCVLWTEDQVIDMRGSGGAFSAKIGEGANLTSGTHSFSQVFSNGITLGSLSGCDLGSDFVPALNDDRTLNVSFNDGGGTQVLPSMVIKSVPFAKEAGTSLAIRGKNISATPPTNNQVLRFDSVGDQWVPVTLPAGGSVNYVDLTFGGGIFNVAGGPVTNAGTFAVTLASQAQNTFFAAPTGSAGAPSFRLMAVNDIPALPASKITSGTLSVDVGGTGLVPGGTLDSNRIYGINAAGTGSEFKSIVAGANVTVDTTVPGQISISSASAGGTVTQVNTGTGLSGGPFTTSGTISLANTSVVAGTYGTSNFSAFFNVDAQGRLTSAGSVAIAINGNQITAGTLNTAQLGDVPFTLLTGTISAAQLGSVDGSSISGLSGSSITSGTINWAILGQVPSAQLAGWYY